VVERHHDLPASYFPEEEVFVGPVEAAM